MDDLFELGIAESGHLVFTEPQIEYLGDWPGDRRSYIHKAQNDGAAPLCDCELVRSRAQGLGNNFTDD